VRRPTAAGQTLDLALPHRPLGEVTPFDAFEAHRNTAWYGFAAPLGCGILLAGARAPVVKSPARAGLLAGLAFQLRDDLIGLFGDERDSGTTEDPDLASRQRTFPLLLAVADRAIRRVTRTDHRALEAPPAPRPAVEISSAALAGLARPTV
jgi:geranylgeranyl diphosphate synthase type I